MNFSTCWNVVDENSLVLLRHDIDFSVEQAHQVALKEAELGVISTYFFMLTTNMYNALAPCNRDLIRSIKEMGHKIAIHFDPTAYRDLYPFLVEKKIFESVFAVDVDVVSIHRPGPFLENNNTDLFGVAQTYQDKYFKEMEYISDSGGKDPVALVTEYLNGIRDKNLQLLTHPIWWVTETQSFHGNIKFMERKKSQLSG